MTPSESSAVVQEIERLENNVQEISKTLKSLKQKALQGKKISADELNIVVTEINRLDVVMRDRSDVGH